MTPSIPACSVALACFVLLTTAQAQGLSPDDALQHSRAKYAALSSYQDTGSVTTSYKSGAAAASVETHTFQTYYRAPRQFYLEFHKGGQSSGERFVIWSEGADFNTWWSATQVHEDYPQGRGATAFALAALPTLGAVVMVPPLLFSKAGLRGPLANFTLTKGEGLEKIAGHPCYRLLGQEALAYKTGNVAGGRKVTVWIDTGSLLVRKVFEDTPEGTGGDVVTTITTTLDPTPNPAIAAARFHFEVPHP